MAGEFPAERDVAYDPDLVWDEDTQDWVDDADLLLRDGSQHHTQFICVGKDLIYYEDIT